MVKILIDTKKIGRKKPTVLKSDIGTVKKSLAFRGKLFDLDNEVRKIENSKEEVDEFDFLRGDNDRMARQIQYTIDFLQDVLELSEDELKKLDELSWEELNELSGEVNNKIMNPNDDKGTDEGTPSKSK